MKTSFHDKKYWTEDFFFGLYVHKNFSNNCWKYINISVEKEIKGLIILKLRYGYALEFLPYICVICWTQTKPHSQIETNLASFESSCLVTDSQYRLDFTSTGQFLWSISSRETQTFYLKKPKENPPKKDRRRKVLPFKSTLHG